MLGHTEKPVDETYGCKTQWMHAHFELWCSFAVFALPLQGQLLVPESGQPGMLLFRRLQVLKARPRPLLALRGIGRHGRSRRAPRRLAWVLSILGQSCTA